MNEPLTVTVHQSLRVYYDRSFDNPLECREFLLSLTGQLIADVTLQRGNEYYKWDFEGNTYSSPEFADFAENLIIAD